MPIVLATVLVLGGTASHSAFAQTRLEVGWIGLEPKLAPPNSLTLSWSWTLARHEVSFSIDPPIEADEIREDNQLSVVSNALSLGLGVEQDVYDWLLEDDGPGFERFMQREVERWNAILARAVYPTAPEGVLDRIRLDTVILRPDGTRAQR